MADSTVSSGAGDVAQTATRRARTATARQVSFEDLVLRRFQAQEQNFSGTTQDEYRATLKKFESEHGPIVDSFWSLYFAAGLALTRRRRFFGLIRSTALHRWTDMSTRRYPDAAADLYGADNLARRCEEVLRGSPQRIALGRVFGAMSSLLSVVELLHSERADARKREAPKQRVPEVRLARWEQERLREAKTHVTRQLRDCAGYYARAAATAAQIFYFWGMLFGVVVIALLTGAVAWVVAWLLERNGIVVPTETYALALAAVSAGGLGACVSAMWRMSSGDFRSDYEAGAEHLRMIGGFRPFIGAVFGLGLFFAIKAGFLSLFEENLNGYLITFTAFIGGFSERFAPDIFGSAAQNIGGRHQERFDTVEEAEPADAIVDATSALPPSLVDEVEPP